MANKAKSIVFIDAGIEAPLQLASGIAFDAEIIILSPFADGVTQITTALKSHPDAVKMAIVSHGAPGQLSLGNSELGLATLPQYRDRLQQWTAQTQITEISFYGCRVAAGDAGAEFLVAVRSLTQANLAASTHVLGRADQGGDWTLDAFWGEVTRRSLLTPEAVAAYPGVLNDNIEDDVPLTPNAPAVTGNNSGATAQPNEPFHDPTLAGAESSFQAFANDSLWWSWDNSPTPGPAITGPVNVNTAGSAIDTVLAVYTGPANATAADLGSFTLVARNDNVAAGDTSSSVTFNAVSGETYYFAVDGVGLQQTSGNGISIALNTPPIIEAAQLFTVPEDGATPPTDGFDSKVNASGTPTTWAITSGNPDTDGDNIKAFAIDPSTGALSVTDADDLDFEGAATNYELTVKASAAGFSDTESVFVQVTNVNEAPEIVSVSAPSTTDEGTSITLNGQIFDPDNGDTQTVTITWGDGTNTTVNNASLVNAGNGNKTFAVSHTYTDDLSGQIKVSVTDSGPLPGTPVTRTISVLNVAPEITQAGPLNFTIQEDDSKSFLLNATDASSVDVLTWSVGDPNNGTVNNPADPNAANQLFTYTPTANFAGTDTFQIQVSDDNGGTDTIDVNVTVTEVADAPTTLNITASADTIDEGETITLSGNFVDPDAGDTFTVTINWGDGSESTVLTNDDLAFNSATNTYSFSSVEHQFLTNGSNTIFVTVEDASGLTDTASEVITVNNIAPTLDPGSTFITIDEDATGAVTFTADDAGDTFNWSIKTNGTNGTAALVAPDGDNSQEFTYTPNADFFGADNFEVQVKDADGSTSSANVTVFINPVNDDPTNLSVTTPGAPVDEGTEIILSGTFDDVDNSTEAFLDDAHSITVDWGDGTSDIFTEADAGIFLNTDQTTVSFQDLKHTYTDEGDGSYTVTITVADAAGETVSTTREIQVLNVDPAVDAASDASPLMTDEDTAVDFTVKATDVGVDDILEWNLISGPANGNVTEVSSPSNGVQTFTYTPDLNFAGPTDTFNLQVTDGDGGFANKTYTVNITPDNDAPTIIVNNFDIVEDQVLPVTLSVLDAQDIDETGGDGAIKFTITGAAAGSFLVDSGAGPVANNVFTRQDIIDGKVSFLYENATNTAPSFTIKVEDSTNAFTTEPGNTEDFTSVDDDPVFADQDTVTAGTQLGTFAVNEGSSALISNSVIKATDEETPNRDLSFTVSDVQGGQFLLDGSPTTEFTQGNINDGLVRFENSDTEIAPSYKITVEDSAGNTSFLNGTGTVVTVNDAPEITQNEFNVTEGEPLTVTSSVLNATDAETTDSAQIRFTISGPDAGSFSRDGTPSTTFTLQDVFAGIVTFLYEENDPPEFDITVEDDGLSNGITGTPASRTVAGNVIFQDVNDAPVLDGDLSNATIEALTGITVNEGGIVKIQSTTANPNIGAVDEESGPANLTFTVSNVDGGDFIVAGSKTNEFTQTQINAGAVFFQHDGTETAPVYTVKVTDGDGLSSSEVTVEGNIGTAVNDPPTIIVNDFNVVEGEELLVTSAVLDATDIDSTTEIEFTVSGANADSFIVNGTPGTTFTQTQIANNEVVFLYNGETTPVFNITANDQDPDNANGATVTVAADVDFTNVNDVPVFLEPIGGGNFEPSDGVLPAFTINENGNVSITSQIIRATDGDFDDRDLEFTVSVNQGGSFFLVGSATPTNTFTQEDVNFGRVIFKSDGSPDNITYSISVTDGEATATATGSGTVTPVNDAPTISVNRFTIEEDVLLPVDSTVLNATDEDNLASELTFTITGDAAGSFLVDSGAGPVADSTFTLEEIFQGKVSFLYENANNVPPTFNVKVTDTAGASDSEAGNIVSFDEANDTPVLDGTPTTDVVDALVGITVDEGGFVRIQSNNIGARDEESGPADLLFKVTNVEGGDFIVGGVVSDEFTQAQINAQTVFFQNDGSEVAPSYTVTVTDGDNATSPPQTITGTIGTTVNDPPTILRNNFAVTEGVELSVTTAVLDAIDQDAADPAPDIQFTITGPNAGSFLINGTAPAGAVTFTRSQIVNGEISFLYDGETSPIFEIIVSDQDTGGAATVTVAGSVEFTAVDDRPIFLQPDGLGGFEPITGDTLPSFNVQEDGNFSITNKIIRATDGDSDDRNLTFTVSEVQGGEFFEIGNPSPITEFDQNDINQGRIFFANDGTETPPSYDISVTDGTSEPTEAQGGGTVVGINDAPTIETNQFDITEGVELTINTDVLEINDVDSLNSEIAIAVEGNTGNATVDAAIDAAFSPGKNFTYADVVAGTVTFLYDGQAEPSFSITVTDNRAVNPTPITLPAVDANVIFTEVNDAPELNITTPIAITEDAAIDITPTLFVVTDEEVTAGQPTSDLVYTVDEVDNGKFLLNGAETTTFTQAQIIANEVDFQHEGEEAPSFTVTLNDNGSPTPESVTKTVTAADFNFTASNDAPVLGNTNLTVTEGGTVTLKTSNLSATDVETNALDLTFTVSNVTNGEFKVNGVSNTTFTLENIVQGEVTFIHDDTGETPTDNKAPSFDVQVTDDGEDADASAIPPLADASSAVTPVTITFNEIDDAPVLTPDGDANNTPSNEGNDPFAITEGGILILNDPIDGFPGIQVTDPDTPPEEIIVTPSNLIGGFFANVSDTETAIASFTLAELNGQQIVFNHDGSESQPSFTLGVKDDATAATNDDVQNYTATLTKVNDAPEITVNKLTLTEGDVITLTTADLQVTDQETGPANIQYDISNLTNGSFLVDDGAGNITTISGDTVNAFDQQDVINGLVAFKHDDSNDAPTYTLTATDDGTGGVVAASSDPSNAIIAFTPVNDAPENNSSTNGEFVINQGETKAITSTQLSFKDEETTNPAQLVYTVDEVNKGSFLVDGEVKTTFTQQDINLNRVAFEHDGSEFAPSYTVTVSDNGVPAPTQSTTLEVDLSGANFINANNLPEIVNNTLTISEGQTVEFNTSILSATDSETANLDLVFTISNIKNGKFTIADNPATGVDESDDIGEDPFTAGNTPVPGGTTSETFTLRDVIEGRVSFTHDGFDEAPAYDIKVTDGDGADSAVESATIAYTRENDNPTLISDTANADLGLAAFSFTISEGDISSIELDQIDAADEPGETAQIDLTFTVAPPVGVTPANAGEVAGGFFARASDTATAITEFTWVEVDNGDIVFNHDGSNVPPAYQLTVTDSEGGSSTAPFTATLVETNDAPTVTTNVLAITEDGEATIDTSVLTVTDEESVPADLKYSIGAVSGGEFQLSGSTLTPGVDIFTQANVIAGEVTFVDDGDDDNAPTFSLTLTDGGIENPSDPTGPFINKETTTLTDADFAVADNFTAVNDLPVSLNLTGVPDGGFIVLPFPEVTEGLSVAVDQSVINMEDEDSAFDELIYTVEAIENASFQINGSDVTSFTQADINSPSTAVTLKHDGSEAAPTFTLSLKDNDGEAGFNQLTQSVEPPFRFANEAPEFTANKLSPIEGGEVTLTAANLAASDREDAATLLQFSIDPASVTDADGDPTDSAGAFFLDGVALTATDKFSIVAINAGLLTFKDDGDEFAPAYEVTVFDTEGESFTQAATIVLDDFQDNDEPTIGVNTFDFQEGKVLILNKDTTENLVASDDETTDLTQLTYTITNLEGGQFLLNGLTETTEFTQQQVNDEAIAFKVSNDGTEPSFTITLTDANGGSTTVEANVNSFVIINDPPQAVDDSATGFSTDQNTPFTTPDLTQNDINEEGTPLTVTQINSGSGTTSKGALVTRTGNTVSYNPNGQFDNLAAGQTTTDSFSYTVTDADAPGAETDSGTVTITITGVNDNPTAANDLTFTANENDFIPLNVLDNDSDVDDGDTLTISEVNTTGVVGTVTNNGTSLSYDASSGGGNLAAGATREENFTYTVSDSSGGSSIASVKIVVTGVNDDPVAVADGGAGSTGFETIDDNQTFTTAVLTANDDDPDEDPLTVFKINDAAANPTDSFFTANGGTVVLNGDGSVDYTPPTAFKALSVGDTQTDTFTYAVSDGQGGESGNATVTITINGANEDPVADDDLSFTTTEGTSIPLDVLANDSDVDVADTLTISSVNTAGLAGTVTNNGTSLTYTPGQTLKGGEVATETFTYSVSDGNGGTDTATVTVEVTGLNDPPIATADSGAGFTTNEVTPFTTNSIFANDFDPEGAPISLVSVSTSGTRGLVTNNGNGTFSYDPNDQFDTVPVGKTAFDTFTYTIQDDAGATAATTVSITVNGLLSSFIDYEQQLRSQNLGAAIPAEQVGAFPLAQIFDEAFYLSQNPDVAALVGSVFSSGYQHFVAFGLDEGRNPSVLYNESFYRAQNPDIAAAIANGSLTSGLRHFLTSGHQEGRDPSALFDQSDYLTNNPDIAAAVNNGSVASGFQHYVLSGVDEQRLPNRSLFNEGFYLATNPDVAAAGVDAFTHFISAGQFEGRRPSSLYSESSYLANNPDVAAAIGGGGFDSGFEHYQQLGRFEGRFVF
ncbi:MAG: cadherin-like domain-containing protein [Leptolyngbyaceae cyanobacterium]